MRDLRAIIWADPVLALAAELRQEAAEQRREWNDDERGVHLDRVAERIDAAVAAGAGATWVPVADAAALLKRHPETVRVRCRRYWLSQGLAQKKGGDWYVHVSALAA